ncbi:MAG: hypothetical protein AAF849_00445 [Bacteroidota bacterium]
MALIFGTEASDFNTRYFDQEPSYDAFWNKNRKPKSTKAQRQEKRKVFWNRVGKNVNESGGAEGIGKTVDNILNLFRANETPTPNQYDYEVGLVDTNTTEAKKDVPQSVYVVGGIILLGMSVLGYMVYKNKAS